MTLPPVPHPKHFQRFLPGSIVKLGVVSSWSGQRHDKARPAAFQLPALFLRVFQQRVGVDDLLSIVLGIHMKDSGGFGRLGLRPLICALKASK